MYTHQHVKRSPAVRSQRSAALSVINSPSSAPPRHLQVHVARQPRHANSAVRTRNTPDRLTDRFVASATLSRLDRKYSSSASTNDFSSRGAPAAHISHVPFPSTPPFSLFDSLFPCVPPLLPPALPSSYPPNLFLPFFCAFPSNPHSCNSNRNIGWAEALAGSGV